MEPCTLSARIVDEYSIKDVDLVYEGEGKPCYLRIVLVKPFHVVQLDDVFPNPVKTSAFLAGLGYAVAVDFLHAFNVPKECSLWHLNHSGWASPSKPGDYCTWQIRKKTKERVDQENPESSPEVSNSI